VQEKGGFLEAFRAGFIQERIKSTAQKRNMDIATRKEILLGTNQYPNPIEAKDQSMDSSVFQPLDCTDDKAEVETLRMYRGGQAFEELRYQTDKFAKSNKRPSVFMLTMGNLAMRRARSQFAGNFFSSAGYEIVDNNGFKTEEEAVKACMEAKADIAVICSSDDEYTEIAPKLLDLLKDKAIVVLAGYPKDLAGELQKKGLKHFIHMRSNVLETLQEFQNELKIK
jgi:methylmalonyl-CoA mutase